MTKSRYGLNIYMVTLKPEATFNNQIWLWHYNLIHWLSQVLIKNFKWRASCTNGYIQHWNDQVTHIILINLCCMNMSGCVSGYKLNFQLAYNHISTEYY